MSPHIVVNPFAAFRHFSSDMGLSYFRHSEDDLCQLVEKYFDSQEPGYRDGVILVNVPTDGFVTGIVKLVETVRFNESPHSHRPGTKLVGCLMARRPGEAPRKMVKAIPTGRALLAKSVQIVLYRNDVLAEDGDNSTHLEDGVAWEVISVNASPYEEPTPIAPDALIANHLHLDGGTDSKMTDEQFVVALRESVKFWNEHAQAAPSNWR